MLWPFFNWIDDRGKKYHEWEGPWPFVVVARGAGKTTTRVWPLFSRAHNDTLESDFYLWPLYRYNHLHADALDDRRTRILFYLFVNVTEKNLETGSLAPPGGFVAACSPGTGISTEPPAANSRAD